MTASIGASRSLLRRTAVLVVSCAMIGPVFAQGVDKHVPARAKPPSKPLTAVSVLPPPAHTSPISRPKSTSHGIIFVGGKSALNPQPIQPGKPPVDPPK